MKNKRFGRNQKSERSDITKRNKRYFIIKSFFAQHSCAFAVLLKTFAKKAFSREAAFSVGIPSCILDELVQFDMIRIYKSGYEITWSGRDLIFEIETEIYHETYNLTIAGHARSAGRAIRASRREI